MAAKTKNRRSSTNAVDRDKVRAVLRKLPDEYLVKLFYKAIDYLPDESLPELFRGYLSNEDLRPAMGESKELVEIARAFHAASLRGEYYEDFDVNSKNCTSMSRGTQTWIAECERLTDLCVAEAKSGKTKKAAEAFGLIFDLLRRIDSGDEEVIFFADEGGSWQVGIDWKNVLPVWFECLAATATPEQYGREVVSVIDKFVHYEREKHLPAARRAANEEQKRALDEVAAAARR